MGKKRKERVILPPALPPDVDDDEIEVSEEDIDFVSGNRQFAGFLKSLDTKSIDRHVTRVADMKEDELEAHYEERSRRASSLKREEESKYQVDRVDALPIKTLDGELKYRTVVETKSEGTLGETESRSSGIERPSKAERRAQTKKGRKEAKKLGKHEEIVDAKEKMHSDVLAKVEEELSAEELFKKKKIKLAEVGLQLLENPEANINTLKELLKICEDKDENIVKLGLMSLLAVFKDIIPGYRIRLPTEKEREMTVSKAVRQTRFYESTLLCSYKAYLGKLIALGKQSTFNQIVVRCLCSLLEAVPHFNFRETLLSAVIKNISSSDGFIRKLTCEVIKSIFKNEGKHGGEATLEAVKLIANRVKISDCNLHPDSIAILLSLTFDEDLGKPDPSEEENVKPKMKGKRKRHEDLCSDRKKSRQELMTKTREEVNLDLKAVSFAPDSKKRKRIQSETLSAVFGIYFRVLKHSMDLPSASSKVNNYAISGGFGAHPLLAPCLDGLGKFAHLIDLDFMGALMNCLRKLSGFCNQLDGFSSRNGLSVSECLRCCVVAFRVMRNNLDALNVDLQDFFVQLYNLLLEYKPDRDQGEVLAEALKIMLCEGKHHDLQRTAAFVKRLSTFSLTFGSAEAMAALVTLKHLLQKNSKCRNLLDNDSGGGSLSGLVAKYQPEATDPNFSGALASVLWELSLLKKHYNPSISSMAASISSMADVNPTQSQIYLSAASPLQAFMDLSMEKDLFKTAGRPPSSSCKRKREREKNSVLVDPDQLQSIGNSIEVDEIKRKMEDHFIVHKSIKDNEKLRRELNVTLASLSLYKEYKKQKTGNTSSKLGEKIK